MSLINDALKKAQKQRTGEAPTLGAMPGIGGESPARIAKRAQPAGFNSLLLRAGVGAGIVLLLGVGAYFAFGGKTETGDGRPESSGTASVPATAPQVSQPAATFTLPVAPKIEPVPVPVPAPQVATQASSPAAPRRDETAVASAKVVEPAVTAPAVVPPKPALKLESRAIQFIEGIKVAGIRASATDSKVLMNDRVYRAGDIVEHEMGLKLTGITSSSLTFEDERGGSYTRNF